MVLASAELLNHQSESTSHPKSLGVYGRFMGLNELCVSVRLLSLSATS